MKTIHNFENHIIDIILERGYDYYKSKTVSNLAQEGNNWAADVQGTDEYFVEITIDNGGEITDWSCDCPYDRGPLCKHVAATLYAIREEWEDGNSTTKPDSAKSKAADKDPLAQILEQLDVAEMRKLLTYFAKRQGEVRAYLLSNYSGSLKISKKQCTQLVQAVIDTYEGDLEYREAQQLGDKVSDLVDNSNNSDPLTLVYLCEAIIEEITKVVIYADDSSGSLGGAIASAFYKLYDLVETKNDTPAELVRHIFDYAIQKSNDEAYESGHWDGDFKSLATNAARSRTEAQQVMEVIEKFIKRKENENYSDYYIEQAQRLKQQLLKSYFSEAEAEELVQQNLRYTSFRTQALERALAEERYKEVRRLAQEGIQLDTERKHPGTVNTWKSWLIRLAEATGDNESLIATNEELFLERGNMEYYRKLRKVIPSADFPKKVEQYIQYFRKRNQRWNKGFNQSVANILEAEGRWQELMEEIKKDNSLSIIDRYFSLLGNKFKADFLKIYIKQVQQKMDSETGRGIYQECCEYIDKIISLGGEEEAKTIVEKWRKKYPRRRAMLEELKRYK